MQTKHSDAWSLRCPKCEDIEKAKESARRCPNCGGRLKSIWRDAFTTEKLDHLNGLTCTNCDMWWDNFNCRKCGAIIKGKNIDVMSCFLTSAACQLNGLNDDCRELSAARRFRDSYLASKYNLDKFNELYSAASNSILTTKSCLPILRRSIKTHIGPAADLVYAEKWDEAHSIFVSLLNDLSEPSQGLLKDVATLIEFLDINKVPTGFADK